MFRLCVLLLACYFLGIQSTQANPSIQSRIVGGTSIEITSVPYIASLQKKGKHICGGSVINERTVVTAAHCLQNERAKSLKVRVGSKTVSRGGKRLQVQAIYQHSSYSSNGLDYDIGLVRLSRSISFSSTVQPINLPKAGQIVCEGVYGRISGWGLTNPSDSKGSKTLNSANVPVIHQSTCNRLIGSLTEVGHLTERMFCAGYIQGGVDPCQSDSGGPMAVGNELIGIVSWGDGCAQRNKPGVYVRVSAVVPWIKDILKDKYEETI